MFIALKPLGTQCKEGPNCGVRQTSAMDVINRLRPKMNRLARSLRRFCRPRRTCASADAAAARFINTPSSPTTSMIWRKWGPVLLANMQKLPDLQDVNTDQQNGGSAGAAHLRPRDRGAPGPDAAIARQLLCSAFCQSEVSVIYTQLNQYYVVMEVAPQYWQDPSG
jgi:multidrug efflux pump